MSRSLMKRNRRHDWRRIYRVFWPRYCDSVCQSRFLYSSACSDHNPIDTRFGGYGYRNIYTSAYRLLYRVLRRLTCRNVQP